MPQALGDIINSVAGFFQQKSIDKEKAKEARIAQQEFEQAENLKNIEFDKLLKDKEDQAKQKTQTTKNLPLSARDISYLHQENPFQHPVNSSNSLYRTSQQQYNLDDLDLTPIERARYRQGLNSTPVNLFVKRTQLRTEPPSTS